MPTWVRRFAIGLMVVVSGVSAAAQEARVGRNTLAIKVLDAEGLAVAGASIELQAPGGRLSLTTDGTGSASARAEFPLRLEVRAAGFEPQARRVESAPDTTLEIRLPLAVVRSAVEVVVRSAGLEGTAGSTLAVERTAARTVFDAVDALLPGAFVTRRGVMGYGIATNGTGGVSIRGIGGQPNTGVLILVDGRPDVQSLMGHPLPDAYSLADAQDVRVTQGPSSVLYGSNAMGGVIDIRPRKPAAGTHGQFSSSLGSFLTGQHRAALGWADDRRYVTMTTAVDHTDGDRPASAYRGETVTLGGGSTFSQAWKGSLRTRFTDFRVEDPGPVTAPLVGSAATVDRGGFSADLDNAASRSWGYARAYASFGHHVITDGFRSTDRTIGARIQQSVAAGRGAVLDAGVDVARFGGRAKNVLTSIDYGEHLGTDAAVFVRAQQMLSSDLELHGGVRYDHNSFSGATLVPEIAGAWRAGERATVSASVARGFRNPTIRELFLFPAPNPSLKPERLWNSQATVEVRPLARMSTSATIYYADLDNQIITLGRYPNLKLQNSGRAVNRGIETRVGWLTASRLQVNVGYAYLRSTRLAPLVPAHKLTCAVDVRLPVVTLHASSMTVGRRWTSDAHTATLAGYSTVALKATAAAGRRASVFVMLDNLFNEQYQVYPGYPMPGANAAGGVTWSF
jgi:outer membrane cobalamin receptor